VKAPRFRPAMFLSRRSSTRRVVVESRLSAEIAEPPRDSRTAKASNRTLATECQPPVAAEVLHASCWYGRRTGDLPADIGCHTIENGELLFCVHPMWYPIVGRQFDVRNCSGCEYFKPVRR